MTNSEMTTRIVKVLRKRFPKLTNMEVINIAYKIVEELQK